MTTAIVGHIQVHVPHITLHKTFLTWEHHLYVLVNNNAANMLVVL